MLQVFDRFKSCKTFYVYSQAAVRKRGVLKNLIKSTGKHVLESLFLIQCQVFVNVIRKGLQRRCFPMNFAKLLECLVYRTPPRGCSCLLDANEINFWWKHMFFIYLKCLLYQYPLHEMLFFDYWVCTSVTVALFQRFQHFFRNLTFFGWLDIRLSRVCIVWDNTVNVHNWIISFSWSPIENMVPNFHSSLYIVSLPLTWAALTPNLVHFEKPTCRKSEPNLNPIKYLY